MEVLAAGISSRIAFLSRLSTGVKVTVLEDDKFIEVLVWDWLPSILQKIEIAMAEIRLIKNSRV